MERAEPWLWPWSFRGNINLRCSMLKCCTLRLWVLLISWRSRRCLTRRRMQSWHYATRKSLSFMPRRNPKYVSSPDLDTGLSSSAGSESKPSTSRFIIYFILPLAHPSLQAGSGRVTTGNKYIFSQPLNNNKMSINSNNVCNKHYSLWYPQLIHI